MHRWVRWVLAGVLIMGLLGSGGGAVLADGPAVGSAGDIAPRAADGQMLTLPLRSEPAVLDSARATDDAALAVLVQVMEGLVRPGPQGATAMGSGTAADWTVSPDGLTWTFRLKSGLQWSDGQRLTAHDFAYGWLRALDPRTASDYAWELYAIKGAAAWNSLDVRSADFQHRAAELRSQVGIRVLDDLTLEVTLAEPTPWFLSQVGLPVFYPQRQDVVERTGDRYGSNPDALVYNGPFVISAWEHDGELQLTRNARYWDAGRVRLGGVRLRILPVGEAARRLYAAGGLDQVAVTAGTLQQDRTSPAFHQEPSPTTWYLQVNTRNAVLQNVHIRRALNLALDRTWLANYSGVGQEPTTGFVPPNLSLGGQNYRKQVGDLLAVTGNATTAQAELAQGLAELHLTELPPLTFVVNASVQSRRYATGIQTVLQYNLPGLLINVAPVEPKVRLDRTIRGDFDLVLTGWGADYDDPNTMLAIWVTGGPFNNASWWNAEYDQLIAAAAKTADPTKRLEILQQAERLLLDAAPVLPLYHPTNAFLRRPQVKGLTPLPLLATYDLKFAYRTASTMVLAAESTAGRVDGRTVTLPAAPRLVDGTLLVPLRFVAEHLGLTVAWDGGQIHLADEATRIDLQVGTAAATVGGRAVTLGQAPRLIDGTVMVPLRFMAEALGAQVNWSPAEAQATISTLGE